MRWRSLDGVGTGVAGICAFVLCLSALAPATLFDSILLRASRGGVRVAEAEGTVWSGAGRLEVRDAAGSRGVGTAVFWRFKPQSLLHGRLGFEVGIGAAAKPFLLTLSPYRIELADAQFTLPAAAIGVALPKLALLDPGGDLQVRVTRLALADGVMLGDALVEWHDAGSSLTEVAPLGDYALRIEGRAGGLGAVLTTVKGPLLLDGKASIGRSSAPLIVATARVEKKYQPQLAPLLRLVGVERPDGSFDLQLNQEMHRAANTAAAPARRQD